MQTVAVPQHSIIVGQVFASRSPAIVSTVLGSCVAACLFDPIARVGGMNHFMLPDAKRDTQSAAFGVHAMELLINRLMQLGAERRRLQAKVFGGGNLLELKGTAMNVGARNVEFVTSFLANEEIPVVARRVGGGAGVKVCFQTNSARALVKPLPQQSLKKTLSSEVQYLRQSPRSTADRAAVTFF